MNSKEMASNFFSYRFKIFKIATVLLCGVIVFFYATPKVFAGWTQTYSDNFDGPYTYSIGSTDGQNGWTQGALKHWLINSSGVEGSKGIGDDGFSSPSYDKQWLNHDSGETANQRLKVDFYVPSGSSYSPEFWLRGSFTGSDVAG